MNDMIMITRQRYEQLVQDSEFLRCLKACGVDNWYGYYEATSMLEEEEEEE